MVMSKDPSKLAVAIIGAGQVGQKHGQAFANLGPDVQIVGVADSDENRAARLAAICSSRAFADYRDLLELAPNIAVVCLPHHLHHEVGLAAAEAGCHILMEKPLAPTLAEARAIVAHCRQRGVYLTVGFVHRYRTEFQQAYQLIASGQLGELTMMTDIFGLPGGVHIPGWVWQSRQAGGGILLYSGIHSLDWQRWLVGSEVNEVFARTVPQRQSSDAEQALVVTLSYANGCLGTLIGHQPGYLVTPRTRSTEIYGLQACLRIRSGEYLEFSNDTQAYRLDVGRDDPFVTQAREFVAAVRGRREPWITGEDGLRALAVSLAIFRSAEMGQPVSVSNIVK